jgi:membrane fusion protein, multidrug efflux system
MSETRIADSALDVERRIEPALRRGTKVAWAGLVLLIAAGAIWATHPWSGQTATTAAAVAPPPPPVTVAKPLTATVANTTILLGQFSAVDSVELRAQVGGVLTSIAFKDGQIVHAGDPLFIIDPRPYQIELDQAIAQLQTAQANQSLDVTQTWRAQQLKKADFGSAEVVDQRIAAQHAAEAAVDTAKAAIRNAQLDLEFAHVAAPFTGRIGKHLVSAGNLVYGSRGGTGGVPATLLATVVSLDPIYLDFDMSESDYAAYQKGHGGAAPHDDVAISLGDDGGKFTVHGTLDFIDNQVNRSSGTIRARATVPNPNLVLTPGQFARLQVPLGQPAPAILLPAAAVIPDQANQVVMTVTQDGTVVPKLVEVGGMYHGLRVIRSGLASTDTVVIDGLVRVRPGAKVTPEQGKITETGNNTAE